MKSLKHLPAVALVALSFSSMASASLTRAELELPRITVEYSTSDGYPLQNVKFYLGASVGKLEWCNTWDGPPIPPAAHLCYDHSIETLMQLDEVSDAAGRVAVAPRTLSYARISHGHPRIQGFSHLGDCGGELAYSFDFGDDCRFDAEESGPVKKQLKKLEKPMSCKLNATRDQLEKRVAELRAQGRCDVR